jgi:hypothetical protein
MGVRLREFTVAGRNIVRDVFIETGTYLGETLALALRAGFKELYSIEISRALADQARHRFQGTDNVHVINGSSPFELRGLVENPNIRAKGVTFWLDANWSGGHEDVCDPQFGQCPLLAELEEIFLYRWGVKPIVLIDDAHMFLKPVPTNFDQAQWPTMDDIKKRIPGDYSVVATIDKNRIRVGEFDGKIPDDVICCLPETL